MNAGNNLVLDFNEICRLCLSKEGIMFPIFEEGSKEDDLPLSSRITMCAAIQVSEGDGLPTLVCDRCINHLDSWFTFKEQCRNSDATLRQFACINEKMSTSDEDVEEENDPEYTVNSAEKLKRVLLGDLKNTVSATVPGACQKIVEERCLLQHPWDCVSVELNENTEGLNENSEELNENGEDSSDEADANFEPESETEVTVKKKRRGRPGKGTCSTCGISFRAGVYLLEHEASHVSEMQFFCKHCNKGFYTRAKLIVHTRSHTRRHCVCHICSKPFNNRSTLKKHLLTHGKDPGFVCFICNKTYKTNEYLKKHVLIHLGERKHVCPTCGRAFKTRKTLRTHIRTHSVDRPAVCPVCCKTFRRKEAMNKHMRVHTGERPYTCPFCERGFSGKWNLTQHIRLHTGAKPYACSYCGKAFTHNVTLRNHMKQAHDNETLINEISLGENEHLIKQLNL